MVTGVFLVTINVVNVWQINYWCPAVVLHCCYVVYISA
jgi:hypothetical protein